MKFLSRSIQGSLTVASVCLVFCAIAAEPAGNNVPGTTSGVEVVDGATAKLREVPPNRFRPIEMFDLETASDPQISPDGTKVVFVRNFSDIMKDRKRSNLWIINYDGSDLRPLTDGNDNDTSPRWSPDGKCLLYVSPAMAQPRSMSAGWTPVRPQS